MLESYISGSLIHLHDIIQLHQSYRFWHYGITLPSDNPNSLAAYLKLNDEQYTTFMTRLGLLRMMENNGKKSLHIITNEWTSFLIGFGLNDVIYFDRMKVLNVPTYGNDVVTYRGYWIGFGKTDVYDNKTTPKTQFQWYEKPPRVSINSYSQKVYELTMIIRKMKEDGITQCNSTNETSNQSINIGIEFESELTNDEKSTAATAAQNLFQFLDDYKFDRRTKEDTMTIITSLIKESIMEDRTKQLAKFVDKVVNNVMVDTNKSRKEELFESDEAKQKKAPAMTQLGIP